MLQNAIDHEAHTLARMFPDYEIAVGQRTDDIVSCAVIIGTKSKVPAAMFYMDEPTASFWAKAGNCFAERIADFEVLKGYRRVN
jgi:hypothetical protein